MSKFKFDPLQSTGEKKQPVLTTTGSKTSLALHFLEKVHSADFSFLAPIHQLVDQLLH